MNDKSAVMAEDGPLWYRGMSQDPAPPSPSKSIGCSRPSASNRSWSAILHRGRHPASICGKVLVIDVGLSSLLRRPSPFACPGGQDTLCRPPRHQIPLPRTPPPTSLRYLKNTVALEPMGSALAKHLAEVEARPRGRPDSFKAVRLARRPVVQDRRFAFLA